MTLSWSNGWRAEAGSNIDARIQSSGLSLAFLNAFSGKAIQGIAGEVEMDLQVRGSLNQPVASGVLRVRDGKLTNALGVQVSSITAEGLRNPAGWECNYRPGPMKGNQRRRFHRVANSCRRVTLRCRQTARR
jgi:hypothetical protein